MLVVIKVIVQTSGGQVIETFSCSETIATTFLHFTPSKKRFVFKFLLEDKEAHLSALERGSRKVRGAHLTYGGPLSAHKRRKRR